jgi:hypothetical protein
VSRPYDLDEHVRRFLARQASPSCRRHEKAGQIGLFDRDDFIESGPRRYESGGLVMGDDGLFSRAVCLHSAAKAAYARRYAEIVGAAMGGKWKSLWWIELFAARGAFDRASVQRLRLR